MRQTSTYTSVRDLNRSLRRIEPEAAAELRKASEVIAAGIADEARGRAMQVGGVARYVAPTIRGTRDRVPVVRMGGSGKLPSTTRSRSGGRQTVGDVIMGAEFGGGRRPTTRQFNPHRGTQGYFLWPTVRARSDRTQELYSAALDRALGDI